MEITSAFLRKAKGKPYRGVIKYRDPANPERTKQITTTFDRELVKTKTQANAALQAWRAEVENKTPMSGIEVPDYVNRYVSMLAKSGNIEKSTANTYRFIAKHIEEGFSGVSIADLSPSDVQVWETRLLDKGLSASTVLKALRLLKQSMENAVEVDGIIQKNPCKKVKPPKRPAANPNALDSDGLARTKEILSTMELKPLTVAAYIALYTGMRRGEICALTWNDIDLERNEVTVSRALGVGAGGVYAKQPKTNQRRVVPFHPDLNEILSEYRSKKKLEWQRANFIKEATPTSDAAFLKQYVLGADDGSFYNPPRLTKEWKSLASLYNLTGTEGELIGFHGLRHSYASTAISNGADVRNVASNLGHANVAVTLNVYASADPEGKRRAAEKVGAALSAKQPAEVIPFDRTGTEDA